MGISGNLTAFAVFYVFYVFIFLGIAASSSSFVVTPTDFLLIVPAAVLTTVAVNCIPRNGLPRE